MAVEPWQRVDPTVHSKIDRRDIVIKTFEVPGENRKAVYATWSAENSHSVAVIALTPDNQVIISRQFRHGPELVLDELPGGGVDKDEDLEVAALRELREETGYESNSIQYLGAKIHDAYSNAMQNYYLARDCTLSEDGQELDQNEQIEVRLISIDELIKTAKSGKMSDVAAVLMAYDELRKIQEVTYG